MSSEARRQLLFEWRVEARAAYGRAIEAGVHLPVILLVDREDPAGRALLDGATPVSGPTPDPQAPSVIVAPLAHLLSEASPLRPAWRRALTVTTQVNADPSLFIIAVVIAHGGCMCQGVPLA